MIEAKLVVCDIDNTLVVKHSPLTPRAKQAINKLKEKGILFGLASGRNVDMLHDLENQWGITADLLIGYNGAELYDTISNETKLYYQMEPEWLKQVMEIMEPFDYNLSLFRGRESWVTKMDSDTSSSKNYLKGNYLIHCVDRHDPVIYSTPSVKIGFRVSAEDMPAIEKRAAEYKNENFIAFKTESTMFEFGNAQANKGKLLKLFCQRENIPLEKVVSFGDMTNDISLFEVSGVAVCMANGSEDAKAAADIITEKGVNEDGFADFVEKNLL